MSRTKTGYKRRQKHKRIMQATKGYREHRGQTYVGSKEAVLHALHHAYRDRRVKKRQARTLWIIRLNAALRERGLTYSRFIKMLADKNITLDRKILSQLAVHDTPVFDKIVEEVGK